jgi:ferredoxin
MLGKEAARTGAEPIHLSVARQLWTGCSMACMTKHSYVCCLRVCPAVCSYQLLQPHARWSGTSLTYPACLDHTCLDTALAAGCGMCNLAAPGTFGMEDEHGRARVHTQWGDDEVRQGLTCSWHCAW